MTSLAETRNATELIDALECAVAHLRDHPHRRGCAVRLPARGKLLATGDLHDHWGNLSKMVRVARLDASPDHHLVVHELIHGEHLINGMDFSYRMLARIAELVNVYPVQVHPLLANHELSQLRNRSVSKGAGDHVTLFNDAIDFVFPDDAPAVLEAINTFIRAMPLAVLSEGGVCCAHSLPNHQVMDAFDPAVLDRDLIDEDYDPPHGAAFIMTWGRTYTGQDVTALAEAWNVRLFCLGHQYVEMGIETRGEQVIVLNSDHERAAVLPIDLADPSAVDMAVMSAIPLNAVTLP